MKRYLDMKIRGKILSGFLLIALIVAVVGSIGALSLSKTRAGIAGMYNEDTVALEKVSDIVQMYQRTRVIVRDIILSDNPQTVLSEADNLAQKDKDIAAALDELAPLLDGEEAKALDAVRQSIKAYEPLRQKVLDAALAGNAAGAYALLGSPDTDAAAMAVQDSITTLQHQVLERAREGYIQNEAIARSAMGITNILVLMGVAIAILVGLFISGVISKPVRQIAQAANNMAAGKTDFVIETAETKDEMGQLASAFKAMQKTVALMMEDVDKLANAAVEGHYTFRAEADRHPGDFGRIIQGFNNTIDTFVGDFEKLPIPVMRIDRDYNIRYINQEGAGMTGADKQSLLGTKCYNAFKTQDCQTSSCACRRAMQLKTYQEHETTASPQQGALLEVRYGATPAFKDGEVIGALEVFTDLTEIKNAQRDAEKQSEALKKLLADIDTAAEQVAAGTKQVSGSSQEISQGATEQASAIEELTATVTQIAAQTRQNAVSASEANHLTIEAMANADRGSESMKAMQKAMCEISEASHNISRVIRVIDDIAFQTNILSLNAAVEAARAGVHGKGFAVVAEEVRNLAARSADAARETAEMIQGSIGKTETGARIADETAAALSAIVAGVEKAAALVDEIAAASNEQASAIAQVHRGIEQLSAVVQTNSATSEETAAAAQELSAQADMLRQLVGRYYLQDSDTKESAARIISAGE